MDDGQFHDANDLLDWLLQQHREGATGSLLVMTRARKVVRIGLHGGEIRRLTFGRKRGREALLDLAAIGLSGYRFLDEVTTDKADDLPETPVLLEGFRASIRSAADTHRSVVLPEPGMQGPSLNTEGAAEVVELLADYVGPAAQWIWDEIVADNRADKSRIEEVVRSYLTREQQKAFRKRLEQLEYR